MSARLAELLADRVEWVTGTRDTEADFSAADTTVFVVLRTLDPADFARGACAFAATLNLDEADGWRRSWTRTRFLFGNPANLPASRVIAPGHTTAWLGPSPDAHPPGVARLLKPVGGSLPALPGEVDVPDPRARRSRARRRRVLRIGVDGLSLVDYLVHLHHTLAEAVLLGRLDPDEPLRLRHEPVVTPESTCAYARVLPDGTRLRPHTWLS